MKIKRWDLSRQGRGGAAAPLPLRQVSDDELATILDAHREWLDAQESGEARGCQADLSRVDLRGRDFAGANLKKANLSEADLRDADLRRANLSEADLTDALLRGAHLEKANMTGAVGLLAEQLGDTNLRRAKMPAEKFEFGALSKVDELSKNAGTLFLTMLVGCAYSWLTIATTKDPQLLTNSATSKLPVVQVEIPIVGFYMLGPLLLLGIYIYFHLYLQRLWEAMATLPAVFPDGMMLDRKTHSWLLNDLVRGHFKFLKPARPPLSWLQEKLSVLLAWWIVPVTFLCFWLRYLTRHQWTGTLLHVALLAVIAWAGIAFYRLAIATLRANEKELQAWRRPPTAGRFYWRGALMLGCGGLFYLLSEGAINGVPVEQANITGSPLLRACP